MRTLTKTALAIVLALTAAIASASHASAWSFEALDGNGGPNGRTSNPVYQSYSAVIYAGQPHAFYHDSAGFDLRHAWWDGAQWNFEVLDGNGGPDGRTTRNVGQYSAVILYGGTPHVFYWDETRSDLRHAWWNGTQWSFETLDGSGGVGGRISSGVGVHTALTLYAGQPHAFYLDTSQGTLRHGWWNGSQWTFEVLDGEGGPNGRTTNYTGRENSVVSYLGQPHVFSVDDFDEDLRHGWWNGSAWQFEVLDGAGGGGGRTNDDTGFDSFPVLYQGEPHIFYKEGSLAGDLRHAWWTGSQWSFETLDGAGGGNGQTTHSVGLDGSGVLFSGEPHLFYHDLTDSELRHAWWNGAAWTFEVLDGEGGPAGRTTNDVGNDSAALSYDGRPHVFYGDFAATDFRHAWH